MKKIKLMLVALMAVFGFNNAMAAPLINSTQYDTNGFQYVILDMTKGAGDVWTGTVSIKKNTFSGTAITINPTVTITVEGEVGLETVSGPIVFDIVEIEANGFAGLESVTSITFEDGCNIEKIGAGAFAGTSVSELDLRPTSIKTLNKLFEDNNVKLNKVYMPTSIETLADNALANCIQLSSVDFTDCINLYYLGDGSLSNTIVSEYDFSDCWNGTTWLDFYAFVNPFVNATTTTNKNLQTVVLPYDAENEFSPVSFIGTTFANCEVLTTITHFEESQVALVDDGAFANDIKLAALEFPFALDQVQGSPFLGCVKLATLTFNNTAANPLIIGDGLVNIYGGVADDLAALTTLKVVVPVDDPLVSCDVTIATGALSGCTGITTLEFAKDGIFDGTINTFALNEKANASITFGNLAATATIVTLTGPKGVYTSELTIGEYDAPIGNAIVDGIVSTATVGEIKEADVLTAIGQAQAIKFAGNITTVKLAAPTVANAALTTIDFGTSENEDVVNISAGFIAATVFDENNAPNLTDVTWKPADASATKAFAKTAFGTVSKGTSAKVTLHTTTAVGDGFYSLLETNLFNVIFDAEPTPAEPTPIEVYGTSTSTYFYGKLYATAKVEIAKTNDDGDQVEVYSAFVDSKDQKIYMDRLNLKDGVYVVKKDETVIIRVKNPTTTEDYTKFEGAKKAVVNAYESNKYNTMRYNPLGGGAYGIINNLQMTDKIFSSDYIGTNYPEKTLYAMANPAKIGELQFDKVEKTGYLPANAVFVETAESAAARLTIEWLNSEEEATGIISNLKVSDNNDGAIYNLQGVRVNAARKGLYIQNGKKFIVK